MSDMMIIDDEITDKCTRCGLCCHYLKKSSDNHITLHRCKHLRGELGNTYCAVYKDRLFRKVADKVLCFPRTKSRLDYPGCQYNTNKQTSILHQGLYNNELKNKTDN